MNRPSARNAANSLSGLTSVEDTCAFLAKSPASVSPFMGDGASAGRLIFTYALLDTMAQPPRLSRPWPRVEAHMRAIGKRGLYLTFCARQALVIPVTRGHEGHAGHPIRQQGLVRARRGEAHRIRTHPPGSQTAALVHGQRGGGRGN